jgi:hypothetical protein
MDKVQKPRNPECYKASSEPFRIYFDTCSKTVSSSKKIRLKRRKNSKMSVRKGEEERVQFWWWDEEMEV